MPGTRPAVRRSPGSENHQTRALATPVQVRRDAGLFIFGADGADSGDDLCRLGGFFRSSEDFPFSDVDSGPPERHTSVDSCVRCGDSAGYGSID